MKTYGKIVGDGLALIVLPILAALVGVLLVLSVPFFLLGLVRRGVVAAITGGDPLVP